MPIQPGVRPLHRPWLRHVASGSFLSPWFPVFFATSICRCSYARDLRCLSPASNPMWRSKPEACYSVSQIIEFAHNDAKKKTDRICFIYTIGITHDTVSQHSSLFQKQRIIFTYSLRKAALSLLRSNLLSRDFSNGFLIGVFRNSFGCEAIIWCSGLVYVLCLL